MPATATAAFSAADILGKGGAAPALTSEYKLDKELGKGAFGTVYLATNKKTGEKVAIKSLSKAKLTCQDDIKDIQGEVAIMDLVAGHKHVVTLRNTYEDKDTVYLVMELCPGGELFDSIVSAGNFSEKKAAAIFSQMAEVVRHCHELGVVHRDLKPENFLLTTKTANADLKVCDFGLSSFFKKGERFKDLVGSPYYVAPEVLQKNYSHQADMWSLGVILYILLSGVPPFWGDTEEAIFKMVLKGEIDFTSDPWPKISDQAKDAIKALLVKDPAKRASAKEILQHDWLAKEGAAPDTTLDSVVLDRMHKFAQMNKLKKMALMVVGQSLNPDELEGLKKLFKGFDMDGSGTITVKEMKRAMESWGHKIPDEELKQLMAITDVDGDGLIDYNEFVAATIHMTKLNREELLVKAFKQLDQDGSGSISADELGEKLKEFGIYDDAKTLLATADTNKDGMIDYAEFSCMMRANNEGLQASGPAQSKGMFSRFM